MEPLYRRSLDDPEAAIFYALALNEAVDHADKTCARQLKAGAILEQVLVQQPNHPGSVANRPRSPLYSTQVGGGNVW